MTNTLQVSSAVVCVFTTQQVVKAIRKTGLYFNSFCGIMCVFLIKARREAVIYFFYG